MITIDWVLLVLMLAGTASLSALAGMLLGCVMSAHKAAQDKQEGLCGDCVGDRCDMCMTEGIYVGYEKRRRR